MPAQATVIWSVEDVWFDDGFGLFGSFRYDAETNRYSFPNFSVGKFESSGIFHFVHTYDAGSPVGVHDANGVVFCVPSVDAADRCLSLAFATPLTATAAGPVVDLLVGPGSFDCYNNCDEFRYIVRGRVRAPESGTLALLGLGLLGLGLTRRSF
jgi:hypothetical protein